MAITLREVFSTKTETLRSKLRKQLPSRPFIRSFGWETSHSARCVALPASGRAIGNEQVKGGVVTVLITPMSL